MITDLRGFPVPNISGSDNQTTAEKIGQNRYFLIDCCKWNWSNQYGEYLCLFSFMRSTSNIYDPATEVMYMCLLSNFERSTSLTVSFENKFLCCLKSLTILFNFKTRKRRKFCQPIQSKGPFRKSAMRKGITLRCWPSWRKWWLDPFREFWPPRSNRLYFMGSRYFPIEY